MYKKIAIVTTGILFLLAAAGYAAAGQGKSSVTANSRQVSSQARNQIQKQIQVDKNCDGPQIKTQTRTRTNYIR